jgi:cell division protein FtsQ
VKRPQGFDRNAPEPARAPRQSQKGPVAAQQRKPSGDGSTRSAATAAAATAAAAARAARRERKRVERHEVKRFTRRSRVRRRIVAGAVAAIVGLFVTVAVVVFSPLMDVETIEVTGTSRLDSSVVSDALRDHVGTPLALIDVAKVEQELAGFAVIRSYSIEAVPPHTLRVAIIEREPIGVVADGSTFAVVDPAGVVVDSVNAQPDTLPIIEAGEASVGNRAFESAVAVLLALPTDLRDRVGTIRATTKDDVEFTLVGGTQTVRWGSSDRSAYKARVFAALVKVQKRSATVEYDVSSPDAAVVRIP